MFSWFGKKEMTEAAKGIGNFIDEQQFTPEEQIKYKLHLFEVMGPFKGIQRIIATYVMLGWFFLLCFACVGLLLGYILTLSGVPKDDALILFNLTMSLVQTEFVWVPCLGVFTLYLSGGLSIFKGKK